MYVNLAKLCIRFKVLNVLAKAKAADFPFRTGNRTQAQLFLTFSRIFQRHSTRDLDA